MAAGQQTGLDALIEFIRVNRGFDFAGYKRPSLERRFQRRMQAVTAASYDDYRRYLARHPGEFAELFDTILINVTSFFRDPPAWDILREEIVPRIVEASRERRSIRVWSVGCASGEEAYTLAMIFAEAMSARAFGSHFKIYATDVDEAALAQGRHGAYDAPQLEPVPPEWRGRYFDRFDQYYVVKPELRRVVIFGRHDALQDPPISRVDLLCCRNTLMYFKPEAQDRILATFHFALRDTGYLFLGKSETLMARTTLFTAVDRKRRIFAKVPQGPVYGLLRPIEPLEQAEQRADELMRDVGFETGPIAQLVVDRNGMLTLVNLQARELFGLEETDIGRPLGDLHVAYQPIDLRQQIESARTSGNVLQTGEVAWRKPGEEPRFFDIQTAPLLGSGGSFIGVAISFVDMTRYKRLEDVVELSKRELETAYEELQSTNEELETTNEELQSTNEELEAMNEELQSNNEELETINDELTLRTDELDQTNVFLSSILQSLDAGVVVLDEQLRVSAWNGGAHDLWGLYGEEVRGQHFMNLDVGLPVAELRTPLRAVLTGDGKTEPFVVDATNRRGRAIRCRISLSPLQGSDGAGPRGVILFMEALEA
jgi:two-component system, chemotaxis family, CheB/CheR fusion protein